MNKPTDPYDPHHVTLQVIIDLQSTNLQRQREIVRLRTDLDKARSDAHEQRDRANEAEHRISKAVAVLESPEPSEGTPKAVLLILRPPTDEES